MTALESLIAELRKLHAAATPGPWVALPRDDSYRRDKAAIMDGRGNVIARVNAGETCDEDARLIAGAHDALPAILDALEGAEQRETALRLTLNDLRGQVLGWAHCQDGDCRARCNAHSKFVIDVREAMFAGAEKMRSLKGEANGGG